MNFNVPVAGWILSIVTLLAGTLVPVLRSRLSYDDIAIKGASSHMSCDACP